MAVAILLSLILLSAAEIAVFILVGDAIGVWRTVALVFLSFLAGILVLRVQGVMTLVRVREALQRGETPAAELFEGACLLIGGILLIIPGLLTDVVGLLLLLPPVRGLARRFIWSRFAGRTEIRTAGAPRGPRGPGGGGPGSRRPGPIIEGDFEEVPTREDAKEGDHRPGRPPDDEPGKSKWGKSGQGGEGRG